MEFDCLSDFGVDESVCSHVRYLSEVEGFCPRTARINSDWLDESMVSASSKKRRSEVPVEELLEQLTVPSDARQAAGLKWMRQRISSAWGSWQHAVRVNDLQHLRRLNVRELARISFVFSACILNSDLNSVDLGTPWSAGH